ncbi:MAG: protoporphyrinogen oxidase [Proteobacteria bacterium]|nr:protoporphyrinogen oxidase [Pseudomonadota bacterium]MBU1736985.1 protoporphyrinogen oxidase [Pseudomonadota bacterium]
MEKRDIVVLGSGLSGLSAGHFIGEKCPGRDVLLIEKEGRPGGAIQSFSQDGYHAEWGPHGFLNNTPESLKILADTGLDQEMMTAPLGDFRRFICFKGGLEPLPQSPKMLLTTPLLSAAGKLRLLADLWKKPKDAPQTISDWARYRFGSGVLPMVDVAVTGTFAGDPDRLSIDAVMPGVRQLEKENGSVLRGLKNKKKMGGDVRKLPAMINFPQGMERLIEVLAERQEIRRNTCITKIKKNDFWELKFEGGALQCRTLVVALPVNSSLQLLSHLSPPPVSSIPGARIVNVVLGFSDMGQIPRGFGYLAPEKEKRFAMGAMFTSHMFPGRCPEGIVMIEALVGGRRHPERLDLSDDELVNKVCEDLGALMNITGKPVFSRVLRPASEIPQLEMDHPALLTWRRDMEESFEGLHICGFGWDGIGMNDMIKSSARAASDIAAGKAGEAGQAPVKPVYF